MASLSTHAQSLEGSTTDSSSQDNACASASPVIRRRKGLFGGRILEDSSSESLTPKLSEISDDLKTIIEKASAASLRSSIPRLRNEQMLGDSLKDLICSSTDVSYPDQVISAFITSTLGVQHVPLALALKTEIAAKGMEADLAFIIVEYVEEIKAQGLDCHAAIFEDFNRFFDTSTEQRKCVWEHTKKGFKSVVDVDDTCDESLTAGIDTQASRLLQRVAFKQSALNCMDMDEVAIEQAYQELVSAIEASRFKHIQSSDGIGDFAVCPTAEL